MSDQVDRMLCYRKNRVSEAQVIALVNRVQGTQPGGPVKLTGAVVFAFGPEYALVTNQKDTMKLLEYGDPIGVVGIGGDGKKKPTFVSFKGHQWADKHAKKIIKQAEDVVDAYRC